MTLRRTEASLIAVSVCGTLLSPVAAAAMQRDSDQIVFDDPRPLAAAVLELEHRCRCVITYEDVRWTQSQVEDAAVVPNRSPDGLRAQVPKGRPLTVTLSRKIDTGVPGEMPAALQAVFQAFEESGNAGAFRVVSTRAGFHVVPAQHALFDVRITLPARTRSVAQAIPEIVAEAGAASGNRILVGSVPVNLLMQTTTDSGASGERFGDVLAGIFASTGRALSWRLLYDFRMKAYYLNIHGVQ
jgi:hypothetical protein